MTLTSFKRSTGQELRQYGYLRLFGEFSFAVDNAKESAGYISTVLLRHLHYSLFITSFTSTGRYELCDLEVEV